MNSNQQERAATKELSVSALLFGILAGFIGVGGGLMLGFALGAALAAALHVFPMECGAGYFAVPIALTVTLWLRQATIKFAISWTIRIDNGSGGTRCPQRVAK